MPKRAAQIKENFRPKGKCQLLESDGIDIFRAILFGMLSAVLFSILSIFCPFERVLPLMTAPGYMQA